MSITKQFKNLTLSFLAFCVLSNVSHAEQWEGVTESSGAIWRSGNVTVGAEPTTGAGAKAQLEVIRPLSGGTELLFSARSTFKEAVGNVLEIDTTRVYTGKARDKASFLPAGAFDLATNSGVAIGLSNFTKPISPDYLLAVGGKVIAEEIRVKLIKDWPDFVFHKDYQLQSLPDVESFIKSNHRLPDMPDQSDVQQNGIGVGEMQSKLLRKVEELTLHVIEQHKTIEALERKLLNLEEKGISVN